MGRALAEAFPESRAVFDEADARSGFALSTLCFEGPEEELRLTANTQPAILADQHRRAARARDAGAAAGLRRRATAWASTRRWWRRGVCRSRTPSSRCGGAGSTCRRPCRSGQGAMAAILNLDLEAVEDACREAAQGEVVSPANLNCPGQVVIAGHAGAVERAMELCKTAGAKRALPLPVSAPVPLRAHAAGAGADGRRTSRRSRSATWTSPLVQQRRRADRAQRRGRARRPGAPGVGRRALAGVDRAAGARGRDHLRRGRPRDRAVGPRARRSIATRGC